MAKKLILPVFYVAEWAFFLYIFLVILLFNLLNYVNLLLVDMPGEDRIPLTAFAGTSFFLILAMGLICFIYMRYLAGHWVYRKIKAAVWGIIFAVNSLGCIFFFSISFGVDLYEGERMILLLATCVSIALTMQIGMKCRSEKTFRE